MKPMMALAVLALAGTVSVQPPPAAPADPLLAEVQAMRAELKQFGGASIRTQLLVARLQLQEQRINTIAKDLEDARRLLSTLPMGLLPLQQELKQLEAARLDPNRMPREREGFEHEIEATKARIADMQRQVATLTDRETSLSASLGTEQARWIDFNARLDQIESELRDIR